MLTVILPGEIAARVRLELIRAGSDEIGGVLMGEHLDHNTYRVSDLTIQGRGTFAAFLRRLADAVTTLRQFFQRTAHNYARFNYLGEWHTHPSFVPDPSAQDDSSMRQIVMDPEVGANFVVLLILKLNGDRELIGTVHTYLPDGTKHRSQLVVK